MAKSPTIELFNIYSLLIKLKSLREQKKFPLDLSVYSTLNLLGNMVHAFSKRTILSLRLKELLNELLLFNEIEITIIKAEVWIKRVMNNEISESIYSNEQILEQNRNIIESEKNRIVNFLENDLERILRDFEKVLSNEDIYFLNKKSISIDDKHKHALANIIAKNLCTPIYKKFKEVATGSVWRANWGGSNDSKEYFFLQELLKDYKVELSKEWSFESKEKLIEEYTSILNSHPIDLLIQIANDYSLVKLHISVVEELDTEILV